MNIWRNGNRGDHARGQADTSRAMLAALDRSQAVIEFSLDGVVLTANENFCKTIGYTLEEIRGKRHRMFVLEAYGRSAEYETFWNDLRRGKCSGREIPAGRQGRQGNLDPGDLQSDRRRAAASPSKSSSSATDVTEIENERKDRVLDRRWL